MTSRVGSGRGRWHEYQNNINTENDYHERTNQNNVHEVEENRFKMAQERILASAQKYMSQEYDSSSEEEDLEPGPILKSVVKDYSGLNEEHEGLEKIHQFLENSLQSGAGICLICIATIKRPDPIWNCLKCYGFFHLICILKWAKDSIFQQKQAQEDLPAFKRNNIIKWPCPKCRHEYEEAAVPEKYICFCGKTENPSYQPFLVPHSCGQRCDKVLQPKCGHSCLLLCHPGPCPPCPKTVQVHCHCKKQGPKIQRCINKLWSCGSICGKPLLCEKHFCKSSCHPNDCPPCNKESIQECNCGSEERKQPCMIPQWQCKKICGKPFSCGFHSCELVCHRGVCGDCPRSQKRCCPCGKSEFQLPCTEEIPACNETCGKLLECKVHSCLQKCHKDKCGMCLEIVVKKCRCGQRKKELPCHKEFLCGTKCKRFRNCSRHPCNRKCCDGNCPPCEKQCSRTLACGNHKCPGACHRGQCYPCPKMVEIACRCGKTVISVPCGREKKTRPQKCNKLCTLPPNCHHPSREPHDCHFGECPPCGQICGKERKNCQHKCPAICHSAVWQKINKNPCPSGPWEAMQIQVKRCNLPCPDCQVPVPVTCLGGHETTDRPCSVSESKPCPRDCGRMLKCENHFCVKPCHPVFGALDLSRAGENCSECESRCSKKRPIGCTHACPNPCHPGDCPPCAFSLKKKCHCSVTFLYIHCGNYNSATDEIREALLSCGNPCPKNYSCGHRCRSICHSGECIETDLCKKKVKLTCSCKNIKEEIPCHVSRSSNMKILPCTNDCLEILNKKKTEEMEQQKKELKEKENNLELINMIEKKFDGKRRRIKRSVSLKNSPSHDKTIFNLRFSLVILAIAAAAAAIFFFFS